MIERAALVGAFLAILIATLASGAHAQQAQELFDDLDTWPTDPNTESAPDPRQETPAEETSDLPEALWSRQIDAEWYLNYNAPLQSNEATGGFF